MLLETFGGHCCLWPALGQNREVYRRAPESFTGRFYGSERGRLCGVFPAREEVERRLVEARRSANTGYSPALCDKAAAGDKETYAIGRLCGDLTSEDRARNVCSDVTTHVGDSICVWD